MARDGAVDVAILGAGPYGLSLAAHLRRAGVSMRQFGGVMQPWRDAMPRGMFLSSPGYASSLCDPDGTHTLAAFCRETGRPYDDGLPVPLAAFIAYGHWFQAELVPGVEETLVTRLTPQTGCFELSLADGERARARRVVVATGLAHFAAMPRELAGLPSSVCTHASAHADLTRFRGLRVVVLGAGQSALETAALLHEQGTDVQLVMREAGAVWAGPRGAVWAGPPGAPDRPVPRRLGEPAAGLGPGWLCSRQPGLFRHLPESTRARWARAAPGPAGASWLRPRVEGRIPVVAGHSLRWARAGPGGVTLGLAGPGGSRREVPADHVIAATGYRPDVARLPFLDGQLRAGLRTVAGTPAVGRDYQSSVPGLYFAGPGVASAFGPAMRFVSGSHHAARVLAPALTATAWRRTPVTAGAAR